MDWSELQGRAIYAASQMGKYGVYSSGAHVTIMISQGWGDLDKKKKAEYRKLFKSWGTEEIAKAELGDTYKK